MQMSAQTHMQTSATDAVANGGQCVNPMLDTEIRHAHARAHPRREGDRYTRRAGWLRKEDPKALRGKGVVETPTDATGRSAHAAGDMHDERRVGADDDAGALELGAELKGGGGVADKESD